MFSNKINSIFAPCRGNVRSLDVLTDATFANQFLDKGVLIEPSDSGKVELYSPTDVEIVSIYPTKHVFGLKTKEGHEIVVHVGTETAILDGAPFDVKVEVGQVIRKGDVLAVVDFDMIKNANINNYVIVICSNAPTIKSLHFGPIEPKDLLFKTDF